MPVPFFDLNRQNEAIKDEINSAISQVVKGGKFILGPNLIELEKEIANYIGVKYAVGVASGTDALHLSLIACGIKAGDEVICPPFTFIATAEIVNYIGAKPVFVDIDPQTFNIDPEKIESTITKKTKAIIPVHLFGQAAEMKRIMEIAKKYNLKVVEDCAQSIGAAYNGKQTGSIGDAGCFSFFPTKNLGCFGDGGMVTTNDDQIAEQLKILRHHGSKTTYYHDIIGYNSRLDDIQAAILRVKLKYLPNYVAKRQQNADFYNNLLLGLSSLIIPFVAPNCKHSYNQYTIKVRGQGSRLKLIEKLKAKGIGHNVYYPVSLHLQKAFEYLGYKKGSFPEAENAQEEVLSLPIFPELTEEEINIVVAPIRSEPLDQ